VKNDLYESVTVWRDPWTQKKRNPKEDLGCGCVEVRDAGEGRRHVEVAHFERGCRQDHPVPRNDRGRISLLRPTKSDGTEHTMEGQVRNWEGTGFYYTQDNPGSKPRVELDVNDYFTLRNLGYRRQHYEYGRISQEREESGVKNRDGWGTGNGKSEPREAQDYGMNTGRALRSTGV